MLITLTSAPFSPKKSTTSHHLFYHQRLPQYQPPLNNRRPPFPITTNIVDGCRPPPSAPPITSIRPTPIAD
ncbi:hypothetical protein HanRHA438_Chr05g0229821 [Helianthus annuus]|uniref:Uncharacterized protein n=1 Tax=Helianthus annuus TaxID=4232 RepID=A0A251UTB9_HELAN|nr:hypothetical protein HanXRQr2_Chr05g0220971 [Helianthus annuus]KAJ0570671.1 hypothetical protein HanHA300_Chr05g0180731 [Helianthus annuus]KAJ0577578.1 hypothetical protein HanIR_Chr05g0237581 [Helianthus annuus]KAJ0585014.1 hypothetical protein HanHA89_Chr05g0195431 [Helianthus annuus]KAJ0750683.1 hypothetical protein HanLR1_Chr05g0184791 [Helianthus annuus]